jgi:hypothetical protein
MVKKSIILLSALAMITTAAVAQKVYPCNTDEYTRELIAKDPKIAQIQEALDKVLRGAISKTTSNSAVYDFKQDSAYAAITKTKLVIPVVVHIIHDFGADYVADTSIYTMIRNMNDVYQGKNADLVDVIPVFKPYIGVMNMEFRLAQRDPNGNPTNGITRRQSYLTNGGDDQAKFDQWAPDRYYNIWLIERIGRGVSNGIVLAYATFPASAAGFPYNDGVIASAAYINDATHTIPHETGHYFNLQHPWNSSGKGAGEACGDDEVDDTPPTTGHFSICPLYDTLCANGYMKSYTYDSSGFPGTAIVDYPDTTNVQNIMDYSACTNMFTKQQILRMRNTLNNAVANRNNLYTASNLAITGVDKVDANGKFIKTDILPVPDFSVEGSNGNRTFYMCATGTNKFQFKNRSWRDTITAVNWEFDNGNATPPNSTDRTGIVQVGVTTPGWVTVKLTATGNNSGDSTITTQRVYAADPNYKINPIGYFQEFSADVNNDIDKWPTFNYYNNPQKWQVTNSTGFYDKSCIAYSGYDLRAFPANQVGSPGGDKDDFFTPLFDLSSQTGDLSLNFMYAGCYRTTDPKLMKDTLEISYSTDCGDTWKKLTQMTKGEISTVGSYGFPYQPTWDGEWKQKSIDIKTTLGGKEKAFFRFRFKSGADPVGFAGTGNNFYIDRINISPYPAGINTLLNNNKTITLAPNPTNGSSYVIIKGRVSSTAQIQVTDITGKIMYSVQQTLDNQISRIEIPASAIAVKGMYMVHVINDNQVQTEKLVAY